MLIETEDGLQVAVSDDLATTVMGGIWFSFKDSIPEAQAKILTDGFNLILLGDPKQSLPETDETENEHGELDFLSAGTENLLPNVITEILVDEEAPLPAKKLEIYELITDNIIDLLESLGFVLNDDALTIEHLPEMIRLGQFFFELQGYEDLLGLGATLEAFDIPPVNRFLLLMQKYLGEEAPLDVYELLLQDVSEVTLKAIRDSLAQGDIDEGIPLPIVTRIRANKALLGETQAYAHVMNNGRVGSPMGTLLTFFESTLSSLLVAPDKDTYLQYAKELAGLYLISELNTPLIKERLGTHLFSIVTDHLAVVAVENLLEQLVLDND